MLWGGGVFLDETVSRRLEVETAPDGTKTEGQWAGGKRVE